MPSKNLLVLNLDEGYSLQCGDLRLNGVHPVVNNIHYPQTDFRVDKEDATTTRLTFELKLEKPASFILSILEGPQGLQLQYSLENKGFSEPLDSFGICFETIIGVERFFANGNHSWDASVFHQVEACPAEQTFLSYAMTQLLSRDAQNILMLGFDRHDRFQQSFIHSPGQESYSLLVETNWDSKPSQDDFCRSETLFIWQADAVESGLREWARLVAGSSPTPPKLSPQRITGWCSWYNYYATINEEKILENLKAACETVKKTNLNLKVFLVDDGFTPEMGDWLFTKPQFPNGMKPIVTKIREAGFIPGLWIAPFLVGNRSKLYSQHPDWLVGDKQTGKPYVCMRFYGEFRWHKQSEEYHILDVTHPEAAAWLTHVIQTWCSDWGVRYLKVDFLHLAMDQGPDRLQTHQGGLTRVEYWRKGIQLIREAAGSETVLAGCGVPLWAGVGLFESVRIGNDMGVEWLESGNQRSPLAAIPNRNFINGILYQTDPDCVLLRSEFHHLTDAETEALVTLAGLSGGVLMTSDKLDEIPEERLALFKRLADIGNHSCDFPLLGKGQDNLIVQVRRNPETDQIEHLFVLNLIMQTRQIQLSASQLGVEKLPNLIDVKTGTKVELEKGYYQIPLTAHEIEWMSKILD